MANFSGQDDNKAQWDSSRLNRPVSKSYYSNAFSPEESAYQRLQDKAAQNLSPYQQQMHAEEASASRAKRQPVERASASYQDPMAGHHMRRRQTVSALGYEPGQGTRPSSIAAEDPSAIGVSFGIDAPQTRTANWHSTAQSAAPSANGGPSKTIIALGVIVVLAIIAAIALFAFGGCSAH